MNPVRHSQTISVLKTLTAAAKAAAPAKIYDCKMCVYFGSTCPECLRRENLIAAVQAAEELIERAELAK